ncbi:MAG TPA: hypothetical protein VH593_21565 [Ktedonobacteraceae bacterium]
MSSALEEMHEIAPHIRVGRARAGVLLLIVADALSVLAILAGGGYLSALNTENQFKVSGDHPPAFLPGLLLAILLVLSGIAFYVWERRARKDGQTGPAAFLVLALIFMIVATVGQTWIGVLLGHSAPFHAYESLLVILTWFSAVHLFLAAIIGLLLIGRVMNGRLVGHGYIAEVVGYWWYYTVIASLLMWVFSLLI